MSISLTSIFPEDAIILSGGETFELTAGKHLVIESSPQGSEHLDEVVPEGKKWNVSVSLQIIETYV